MDPGSYVAHVEPNAMITTTTPWYGAANGPGFVTFGQLDHFPYAELFLLNLDEVIERPQDPGDPWKTAPAPDDLYTWFVERSGAEIVGEPVTFEVDGYEAQQVDLRVSPDTQCAPKATRPWPEACLLIFPTYGDPPVFALGGIWMRYRLVVLPDVDGRTDHDPLLRLRQELRRPRAGRRRSHPLDDVRRVTSRCEGRRR